MTYSIVLWGMGRLCAGFSDVMFGNYFDKLFNNVDVENILNFVMIVSYVFFYLFVSEIIPI